MADESISQQAAYLCPRVCPTVPELLFSSIFILCRWISRPVQNAGSGLSSDCPFPVSSGWPCLATAGERADGTKTICRIFLCHRPAARSYYLRRCTKHTAVVAATISAHFSSRIRHRYMFIMDTKKKNSPVRREFCLGLTFSL